mgnify:FL=1
MLVLGLIESLDERLQSKLRLRLADERRVIIDFRIFIPMGMGTILSIGRLILLQSQFLKFEMVV